MQRRYEEAEPLLRRALDMYQQLLGEDNPDTRIAARNLGVLLTRQGRGNEAVGLFTGLLTSYSASRIGLEPLLARDLHRLADQYVAQGELQSAEPLYKRALQINQRALGEGHLRNARTLLQLGDLYRHLALYALAAPHYREALRLLSAAPDTGSVMREDVRARLAGLPSPGDDTP